MLLSIGHGEFPDLNFRLAPSCPLEGKPSILIMNKPLKQPSTQNAFRPLYFFENIAAGPQNIIPKKGEIKILENNIEEISKEKSLKKIFEVSYEVNHDTYSDISTQHSVDLNYNYNCNFNFITENDITKFNNDEKLKKIHSTYHLKRKVSSKLQNQVRNSANNLIDKCNKILDNIKIPYFAVFSKIFREDVKIDNLRKIKNCTLDKYLKEDIQCAGRSLNIKNSKIIELIKDINEKYGEKEPIKKLNDFLFKNIVIDYYNDFLESDDFKICMDKDVQRYIEKLNSLDYPEDKIQLYKKIFKEKYEGIAKCLFDSD